MYGHGSLQLEPREGLTVLAGRKRTVPIASYAGPATEVVYGQRAAWRVV
jgi:hypothetical protein